MLKKTLVRDQFPLAVFENNFKKMNKHFYYAGIFPLAVFSVQ